MTSDGPRFFHDLVDPLSYLLEYELRRFEKDSGVRVERVPFELRSPPAPLVDPDDPEWRSRWAQAGSAARDLGLSLVEPPLVPWSRKAHELVLHAGELGRADEVRWGLYRLAFQEGADLGRVDVLVGFARDLGMDASHTKAVLDVDRHAEAVAAAADAARAAGAAAPPALVREGRVLQGFHNRDALGTFLG